MMSRLKRWLATVSVAFVAGCGGGDDPGNVLETARNNQYTILGEAVTTAGLTATLSGPGPFTVFAPTDAAFAALLAELGITKAQLLADSALLTKVLTYHVVPGEVKKASVPLGTAITTVQGGGFRVDSSAGALVITDERGRTATITSTDIRASNGVIHGIDRVLLPRGTVVEMAQANPVFSTLVEALVAANLTSALSGSGPFTVFAPTNEAFAALLTELGLTKAELLANKPLLTEVLRYHVLSSRVVSSAVPLGLPITPLQAGFFKVSATASGLAITDGRNRTAKIVTADVNATNGVIHVIDRVILPANLDIVQTAAANPNFSLLVEAVTAAGLGPILSQPGPFTVFAPTNAAFVALLAELGTTKEALFANRELLTQVLTYHVVAGNVLKAAVPTGTAVATLAGPTKTLTVSPSLVITDQRGRTANIVATDVLTRNGVIHVIDRVILPN
jgi:uncharacterized surface protein with fasciclin (FAS1) repeats